MTFILSCPTTPRDAAKSGAVRVPRRSLSVKKCVWINYLWCSHHQLFRNKCVIDSYRVWPVRFFIFCLFVCLAVCRFSFKLLAKCLVSSSRVSLCEGGCAELSRMFIPQSIYLIGCLFKRENTLFFFFFFTWQLMWWITSRLLQCFIEYDTRLINQKQTWGKKLIKKERKKEKGKLGSD